MTCNVNQAHDGPCGPDCLFHDYHGGSKEPDPTTPPKPGQQHFLVAIRHSGMPIEQQWQFVMEWAEEWQAKVDRLEDNAGRLLSACKAALYAIEKLGHSSADATRAGTACAMLENAIAKAEAPAPA
jgi:hypothetical protein